MKRKNKGGNAKGVALDRNHNQKNSGVSILLVDGHTSAEKEQASSSECGSCLRAEKNKMPDRLGLANYGR